MFPGHPGHVSRHHHGQHPVSHITMCHDYESLINYVRCWAKFKVRFTPIDSLYTEIKIWQIARTIQNKKKVQTLHSKSTTQSHTVGPIVPRHALHKHVNPSTVH